MAQYTTVVWDEGDEVTSQKLEQMAQNETWLKDNLIIGNNNYIANALGQTAGRTTGIASTTKLEVIEVEFDSQVPVVYHDFVVRFPPVFTEPPVVFYSHSDHDENTVVRHFTKGGATSATFRVWNTAGTSHRKHGTLGILLLGK